MISKCNIFTEKFYLKEYDFIIVGSGPGKLIESDALKSD